MNQTLTKVAQLLNLVERTPSPVQMLVDMSKAALADRDMDARAAGLELTRWAKENRLSDVSAPNVSPRVLIACAALIELFSQRFGQEPPEWTRSVGSLPEPFYFFPLAREDAEFRADLERQTPEPLRKRNLFSTSNYLRHV